MKKLLIAGICVAAINLAHGQDIDIDLDFAPLNETYTEELESPEMSYVEVTPENLAAISKEEFKIIKKALKDLRKDYSDEEYESIKIKSDSAKHQLEDHIQRHNSQFFNSSSDYVYEDEEDDEEIEYVIEIVLNEEEEYKVDEDDEFRILSIAYKTLEYQYNKATLVRTFSKSSNQDKDYALVILNIAINELNLKTYLEKSKETKKPKSEQIHEVKNAISELIEEILTNQVYGS